MEAMALLQTEHLWKKTVGPTVDGLSKHRLATHCLNKKRRVLLICKFATEPGGFLVPLNSSIGLKGNLGFVSFTEKTEEVAFSILDEFIIHHVRVGVMCV